MKEKINECRPRAVTEKCLINKMHGLHCGQCGPIGLPLLPQVIHNPRIKTTNVHEYMIKELSRSSCRPASKTVDEINSTCLSIRLWLT